MRGAFIRTLADLAASDRRIVLLTGDLGYMAVESFADRYPDRFFNVGVAEQNMVGIATGLAEAGWLPFVYSIVTFATLRPYEFIRNGPILHRLPVRIVGVGGGVEYGHNGPTHYGLEDVGILRVQPGITVLAPADHAQAAAALSATWDLPGPVYYRLGKDDKTTVAGLDGRFSLDRAERIREGRDLLMLAMGSVATEAAQAVDQLAQQGVSCTLLVVPCLNPPPEDDLAAELSRHRTAITVEAHYVVGGLGSLVSEIVAERGIGCRVVRCGIRDVPDGTSGSMSFLYQKHGLSSDALVAAALRECRRGMRQVAAGS